MKNSISRRNFLKMSALGGATVVAAGCSDPIEKLIPLQTPPYDYVSGVSTHFATTCRECSAACGLIVRTREGRAIKAEGNPRHPINEGRICLQGQSVLQGLFSSFSLFTSCSFACFQLTPCRLSLVTAIGLIALAGL